MKTNSYTITLRKYNFSSVHVNGCLCIGNIVAFSTVFFFCLFVFVFFMIHTVKGFSVVNETEVDIFLDHLTCLLRNLYAWQEAKIRTLYGTTEWFRIEKGVCQGCLLFNLYGEHIIRNARLDELQMESQFLGEISATSDIQMIPL